MTLDKQLITRLEDKVLETYLKAEKLFGKTFELPKIEFKDMGRTAGKAHYIPNRITLSPTLFRENIEAFLSRTVPHEIAHLVCHKVSPAAKQAHGPEWRKVMQILGVQDISRCHSYDTSSTAKERKSQSKFGYQCGFPCFSTYWLGGIRHKKIQSGSTYLCPKCKQKISFTGQKTIA